MTPPELGFRAREKGHTIAEQIEWFRHPGWKTGALGDRLAVSSPELAAAHRALKRNDRPAAGASLTASLISAVPRFPVHPAERSSTVDRVVGRFPDAAADAARRAERVLSNKYDLLGYKALEFGAAGEIDWHLDPVSGRRAPSSSFWARVPYLDPRLGDHKVIWELNRHQHWLTLGRAFWLTRDPRYRQRFVLELTSWLRHNPPYSGVNWASMLELAFRSLSWTWALHLFADADDEDPSWVVDLLLGVATQLDHVSRHLSWYFSPNTHLLGEGLALYVAGRTLPEFRQARHWDALGRSVLLRERQAQVRPDGGHAEQSLHYHRYALDFYLLALAVARRSNDEAGDAFAEVVARLARFCRLMADDTGRLATIGDDDGGSLFPICGRAPFDAAPSLATAAVLLDEPGLAVGPLTEEALWIAGDAVKRFDSRTPAAADRPESVVFRDSGYASLRSDRAHAIVDIGPHGFLNGGHAHADALSLTLTLDRHPLLIDPGTATYTMNREVRDRFRSTAMHNSVTIDGRTQSVPSGPFHWATRADARLVRCHAMPGFDYVEAEHRAYDPAIHRRVVMRFGDLWVVIDRVIGQGAHEVDVNWHVAPEWRVDRSATSFTLSHPDGARALIASTAGHATEFHGEPGGPGWQAPVYGTLVPAHTIRFSLTAGLPVSIVTAIVPADTSPALVIDSLPVCKAEPDSWHSVAVRVACGNTRSIVFSAVPSDPRESQAPLRTTPVDQAECSTDAVAGMLCLAPSGEPRSLTLLNGRRAVWTGPAPFSLTRPMAEDLQLGPEALAQLSCESPLRSVG